MSRVVHRARWREWYVTAAHGRHARRGNEVAWVATSLTHLKKLGSLETACGLSTVHWQIFWLRDPCREAGVCDDCLAVRDGGLDGLTGGTDSLSDRRSP